jgi:predicted secreted Zn-dependent protease
MRRIRNIISVAAIIMLFACVSYAETKTATIYAYYPITGDNIDEIRHTLQINGLKDSENHVFTAKTTPKFTWKYNFSESAMGCSIKSTNVEVEITYQLPKLLNYDNLSASDKAEWDRYYANTYKHEQGHTQISTETAKKIEWETQNILPKSTCGETARTANLLVSNILNNHDKDNLNYDAVTNHGVQQGAVLIAKE